MKRKKLLATIMCLATLFSFASICNAASSANWEVNYHPHTTYPYNIPTDIVYVSYYSDGYEATCNHIEGGQGRQVTLTSPTMGGIGTKYITTTGSTGHFYLNGSTTGNVTFVFTAREDIWCYAYGKVKIWL